MVQLVARIRALSLLTAVAIVALTATRPTITATVAGDGEAIMLAATWLAAAAVTAWYTLGLALCVAARMYPTRRGLRCCTAFAPVLVRRAAGFAWGASLVVAPALAHTPARAFPRTAVVAVDEPIVRAPDPTTTTTTAATMPAPVPIAAAAPIPEVAPPVTRNHVVEAGDSLWTIAATELAAQGDTSERGVAVYWRAVVEANRAALRSGNPNLIFPGEVIALPPHG